MRTALGIVLVLGFAVSLSTFCNGQMKGQLVRTSIVWNEARSIVIRTLCDGKTHGTWFVANCRKSFLRKPNCESFLLAMAIDGTR